MGTLIFETKRLIVRQYVFETDADNFFAINGDEEIMRYIRTTKSKEECDDFLKQVVDAYKIDPLIGRWGVDDKVTGRFIGSFAIIPVEGTADIQLGYALLKEYWGQGYASELTKAGLDYYFSKTGANHIYAIAEKDNTASHHVLLKNGFVPDGTIQEGEKGLLRFIFLRPN